MVDRKRSGRERGAFQPYKQGGRWRVGTAHYSEPRQRAIDRRPMGRKRESIGSDVLQVRSAHDVRDWRHDRIGSAHRGENPMVIARMPSGFAVIGDTQHLPGYSLLLTGDPANDHLSDLPWPERREFLFDMALIGEAIQEVCAARGLRRINYEVLGNSLPILHAHVHPRYDWEPEEFIGGPVWRYPKEVRDAPEHAYSEEKHGQLKAALKVALEDLMRRAGVA